jgi:hypothetical protein
MVQQPAVGRMDRPPGDELVDLGAEPLGLRGGLGRGQRAGVTLVTDRQGSLEDAADGVRGGGLPALGIGQQLADPAQQVRHTRLMNGGDELAVRRPPVPLQHPLEPLPQDHGSVIEAATGGDGVHRDLLPGKRPQPRPPPTRPPAGLIRRHHRAGLDPLDERQVGRRRPPGGAGDRLDHPTRGDRHAELAEQPGDLAGRQPQPLAQPGGQRDHTRPKLHPAAPSASEVCSGWRGWTRRPQPPQRPICTW